MISQKQRRFGSGAKAANMTASEGASVGFFLVCGEAARDGGRDLLHQGTMAFTWRGQPGRERGQGRARSLQRTQLLPPPAPTLQQENTVRKKQRMAFIIFWILS